jgi:HlyD family secretion protein
MNDDPKSKISQLHIDPAARRRSTGTMWLIFLGVALIAVVAVLFWRPWAGEGIRFARGGKTYTPATGDPTAGVTATNTTTLPAAPAADLVSNTVLTVSGYIVNRERIEISPRFMGLVQWIGVNKGDAVTNGQVIVRLDDAEYRAQFNAAVARLATAKANLDRSEVDYRRILSLSTNNIETRANEDDARLQVEANRAALAEAEANRDLYRTYLDWCVIRSPINGVVLEKLTRAGEVVTPQSFGGAGGPSTALLSVGDPKDLQVEIDLNEADLAKVHLHQSCKISPEAYPDRSYDGTVVEIAPEASRQKGTLQIKVQIKDPDSYLTPELSAKVDFLGK